MSTNEAKELALKMYPTHDSKEIAIATGLTTNQIRSYAFYAGIKKTMHFVKYPAYYQFATEILEKYPKVQSDVLAAEYGITPLQLQQFAFKYKVTKRGVLNLDYDELKRVEIMAAKQAKLVVPDIIKEDEPSELEAAGFFDLDKYFKQF